MSFFTLRRTIIFGGLAALGAAAFSSRSVCARRLADTPPLERLDVALIDIPFAERIAADYRQHRTEDAMIAELYEDRAILTALDTSCPATRRAYLRAHAQEEFRTGKACLAGRMVVSRSERLIAALRMPA